MVSGEPKTRALPGFTLDNAVERNRESPTFEIPAALIRENLSVGASVKLLVRWTESNICERMWFEVVEAGDGTYSGVLRNTPCYSEALLPGDRVEFEPQHVAAILPESLLQMVLE